MIHDVVIDVITEQKHIVNIVLQLPRLPIPLSYWFPNGDSNSANTVGCSHRKKEREIWDGEVSAGWRESSLLTGSGEEGHTIWWRNRQRKTWSKGRGKEKHTGTLIERERVCACATETDRSADRPLHVWCNNSLFGCWVSVLQPCRPYGQSEKCVCDGNAEKVMITPVPWAKLPDRWLVHHTHCNENPSLSSHTKSFGTMHWLAWRPDSLRQIIASELVMTSAYAVCVWKCNVMLS